MGWIAFDPETGANLRKADYSPPPGKKARYHLYTKGRLCPVVFRAYEDAEAVEDARQYMQDVADTKQAE